MATYIKKLSLRNFKSFKETTVTLPAGIVCFAGPNGSGKSNVADAIRFVLGEQSFKSLRVDKTADLIHTGASSAHVTVVFQGETPLEITRSIDENGKIHYFLNGKSVTRTSVVSALRSLSVDPALTNIIPQGEVQQIVDMNPVQRREILDTSAGIFEYEEKKREALKELQRVEQKIAETQFILNERKGRLTELEKEKNDAVRYVELQATLRRTHASLVYRNLMTIDTQHTEVLERYATLAEDGDQLQAAIDALDGEIKEVEAKKHAIITAINEERTREHTYRALEEAKASLTLTHNLLERTRSELEKLDQQKKTIEKQISAHEHTIESLLASIKNLEEERKKLAQEKERVDAEYGTACAEEEKRRTRLLQEVQELLSKEKELAVEQEKLHVAMQATRERMIQYAREREELEARLRDSAPTDVLSTIEQLRERRQEISRELEKCFVREKELNKLIPLVEKELFALKEKQASLPQRRAAVVSLIKQAKEELKLNGIFGTVGELAQYDDAYAMAVEAAAGSRLEYVVVDSIATATAVIEWLKKKKAGRLTFLPLDALKTKPPQKIDEGMGLLVNHLTYEPRFQRAFHYVFGDTLLVRDIVEAKHIGVGKYRMVTLEGDVFEHTGVVSGGYIKPTFSADILAKKIEEQTEKRAAIVEELQQLRETMSKLRNEKADVEVKLKSKEIEAERVRERADEHRKIRERIAELSRELERSQTFLLSSQEKVKALAREAESVVRERQQREIKVHANAVPQAHEEKSDVRIAEEKLAALRGRISECEGTIRAQKHEIEKLRADIALLEEQREANRRERLAREEEMDALHEKISHLERTIEEKERTLTSASAKLEKLWEEQKQYEARLSELVQKRGELSQKKDRITRELLKVTSEKEKLEVRLTDLKAQFAEYEGDEKELDQESPLEKLETMVADLRAQIDALGPVNLKAPEEYEKKAAEVQEVTVKMDKLIEEKGAVFKMIEEIDTKKKHVFLQTFTEVASQFRQLYQRIFAHGTATLSLENPEDPFSGGLHISVSVEDQKHPGKYITKLIDSLSGGEKTLVALLFLFALQLCRPSPFYILDEADAALDKENSKKLAKLLRELSPTTQFLVITHNDVLMEHADVVLGVSRQNHVSRIVGVELTPAQQPPLVATSVAPARP